jgi:starvation-inducible DNA-binding protein
MDEVAERIRKIGHYALGSMKHFLKEASLLENEDTENIIGDYVTRVALMIMKQLFAGCGPTLKKFQDKYKDAGSADFITGLVEQHETHGLDVACNCQKIIGSLTLKTTKICKR